MVRLYLREKAKTSLILLLYTGSSLTRRYAGLINLEKKNAFGSPQYYSTWQFRPDWFPTRQNQKCFELYQWNWPTCSIMYPQFGVFDKLELAGISCTALPGRLRSNFREFLTYLHLFGRLCRLIKLKVFHVDALIFTVAR